MATDNYLEEQEVEPLHWEEPPGAGLRSLYKTIRKYVYNDVHGILRVMASIHEMDADGVELADVEKRVVRYNCGERWC